MITSKLFELIVLVSRLVDWLFLCEDVKMRIEEMVPCDDVRQRLRLPIYIFEEYNAIDILHCPRRGRKPRGEGSQSLLRISDRPIPLEAPELQND
jgi:hypothetical protein